jgi:hypothetical protein
MHVDDVAGNIRQAVNMGIILAGKRFEQKSRREQEGGEREQPPVRPTSQLLSARPTSQPLPAAAAPLRPLPPLEYPLASGTIAGSDGQVKVGPAG